MILQFDGLVCELKQGSKSTPFKVSCWGLILFVGKNPEDRMNIFRSRKESKLKLVNLTKKIVTVIFVVMNVCAAFIPSKMK